MDTESRREALEFIRRHGDAIGRATEVAWNLREFLRECVSCPSLRPVLESLLPRLKADLELVFIDSHLAHLTSELPHDDELSAAALIAFVENLRLPGGARIQPPAGDPPEKWITLSRCRATMLAKRVVDESGNQLFDENSPDDLDAIERLPDADLTHIWEAGEELDSGKSIAKVANVDLATFQKIADGLQESLTRLGSINELSDVYVKADRTICQPGGDDPPKPAKVEGDVAHSDDFRSINWFGAEYSFSPNQAACIKVLWENWERGTPEVGDQTVLEAADSSQDRLDMVFRDSEAWGSVIQPGKKRGSRRLAEPEG